MQFERLYSLKHSEVALFARAYYLGFKQAFLNLLATFVLVMVWLCVNTPIRC